MEALKDILAGFKSFYIPDIPEIRPQDIIDILIVTFLIYKVMLWIKQTRAWSLAKGISLILLAFLISSYYGLHTVRWLIENSISTGLIALIILFQPEIRKALERIGKNKINLPFEMGEEEASVFVIDEITNAVFSMSKQRTGALILIERNVGLGDHEKTGIPIDALVTSQLLINIFEDKTPLHDGAVIIRGSRIVSATCILPLTQNEIGRELGTRHRAAVGASEVSDADIIVVSEETGAVSVANSGKLYRNLSKGELQDMLAKPTKHEKKFLGFWKGWHSNEKHK